MSRLLLAIPIIVLLVAVVTIALARRSSRIEAHRLVENAGALLVDVRTPEEFAAGHLPGAVNIPLDQLPKRFDEIGRPDRPVVVYCRSGMRSRIARRQFETAGFETVHDLGAMSTW